MTQSAGSAVQAKQPAPERPRKPCRFRMFLLGASLSMFAVLVGAGWWPLKYTTVAKLERRSDSASEDLVRGKSESFEAIKMVLQQELVGTNAVEAAVEELEKTRLLPPLPRGQDGQLTSDGKMQRQQLVRGLIEDLKVNFEVRTPEVDLISVAFTDADPRLAQQLPNTLITNYINRISDKMVTNLTSSRDFLKTKVDEANTRFSELMKKRIDFEIRHAGMLPDNPGALQLEIQRVKSDMDTVRRQQALAKMKLDQIRVMLRKVETPGTPPKDKPDAKSDEKGGAAAGAEKPASPSAMAVEQEYRDAMQELARLQDQQQQYQRSLDEARALSQMSDKHPKVMAMRKQTADLDKRIAEVKAQIPELEKRITESRKGSFVAPMLADGSGEPDPAMQRGIELQQANLALQEMMAQSEYQSASNELERLQAHLDNLRESLLNYGPVRYEYMRILKEVAGQQAEVDRWEERLVGVQMALAAEAAKRRTHLTQVELAQEQFVPSSPKLLDVLAIAILGGLAFGTVWVLLFWRVRLGGLGRILLTFGNVILLWAAATALLNFTLWLNFPREEYASWKADPASYVCKQFSDWAQ